MTTEVSYVLNTDMQPSPLLVFTKQIQQSALVKMVGLPIENCSLAEDLGPSWRVKPFFAILSRHNKARLLIATRAYLKCNIWPVHNCDPQSAQILSCVELCH